MSDPILDPFAAQMRQTLLRSIVQRTIFCPVSGDVLDVRKCVVFVDRDGDPSQVLSQRGWKHLSDVTTDKGHDPVAILAEQGIFLDRSTVKGA